jgi:hypothetical protein
LAEVAGAMVKPSADGGVTSSTKAAVRENAIDSASDSGATARPPRSAAASNPGPSPTHAQPPRDAAGADDAEGN